MGLPLLVSGPRFLIRARTTTKAIAEGLATWVASRFEPGMTGKPWGFDSSAFRQTYSKHPNPKGTDNTTGLLGRAIKHQQLGLAFGTSL